MHQGWCPRVGGHIFTFSQKSPLREDPDFTELISSYHQTYQPQKKSGLGRGAAQQPNAEIKTVEQYVLATAHTDRHTARFSKCESCSVLRVCCSVFVWCVVWSLFCVLGPVSCNFSATADCLRGELSCISLWVFSHFSPLLVHSSDPAISAKHTPQALRFTKGFLTCCAHTEPHSWCIVGAMAAKYIPQILRVPLEFLTLCSPTLSPTLGAFSPIPVVSVKYRVPVGSSM